MQHEVQALLKALLAEQQRERDLYHSLLASMSVAAAARKRMLEDIVSASGVAMAADMDVDHSTSAYVQDHLTQAIKRMAETRNSMFSHNLN